MLRMVLSLALVAALGGCGMAPAPQHKEQIDRALRNLGFKNGRGYAFCWFCCGRDDSYRYSFTAENAHGETVTGQVCAGLFFKGWTVRTD